MGYYVQITSVDAKIPFDKTEAAYEAMVALNSKDEVKQLTFIKDGEIVREFMRLDHDYPTHLKSAAEILEALRFQVTVEETGDITIEGFDAKTGDEDAFIDALAPFIVSAYDPDGEAYMEWRGEEGELWRQLFIDGKVKYETGKITWE
jgi:hypothetical protein